MKTKVVWQFSVVVLISIMATGVWAGHHQTNPKHHIHTIMDSSDRAIQFDAKLRIGWRGHQKILDQVKYELHNRSYLSFEVKGVRIVRKSDNKVLWSSTDNKLIKGGKKGKHEWRGNFMHAKKIQRSGIRMEIQLYAPAKYWILKWDPSVGGSASTWVEQGRW